MRAKPVDDVLRVVGLDLEEVGLVHDLQDQFLHVVRLVRVGRDQRIEREIVTIGWIGGHPDRRLFAVGQRQEIDEAPGLEQRFHVVLERQIGDAGLRGMGDGAAQFLGGDDLMGDGLDHVGTGHEHVGAVLHHEDEVGHGRGVHGAAGARPHDQRDLRDDAGCHHVALEHLGVSAERSDAFLDARAAAVVQPDHRGADLQRLIHDLADLLGMGFRQGAAEHGEVLREDEDETAIDGAVAGDDAVAGNLLLVHAEIGATMLDEHVPFFE